MIIFALDSTQEEVSCALYEGSTRLAFGQWVLKKTEHIPICVASFLKGLSVKPSDIGRLAVITGPGNYSSLRNGLITLKTMSQCLNTPIVAFNKVEVMCYRYRYINQWVAPVIDVRQNTVYSGMGRYEPNDHRVAYQQSPGFMLRETWQQQLPVINVIIVGSTPDATDERFRLDLPFGYACEAAEMAGYKQQTLSFAELKPLYAREAVFQKIP